MSRLMIIIIFLIGLTGTAIGETPMSGDAFDTYTRLKTLTYLKNGRPYGAEQYLDRRRVKWSYLDEECLDGYWFEPDPGLICFQYENTDDDAQCWNFFITDNGLRASFVGDDSDTELYETRSSADPLLCIGPKIGV